MSRTSIDHPDHYYNGTMECIDAIEGMLGGQSNAYYRGNILKYLWRYEEKGGLSDLHKAQWYLNRLIDFEEEAVMEIKVEGAD